MLSGDFAGYKNCYVGVSALIQEDLVYQIVVLFLSNDTCSRFSISYFDLKELLTEKYRKPSHVVEKFEGYPKPQDDNSRMYEISMDRCKYHYIWEIDKGEIQLLIEQFGFSQALVKLGYLDKINGDKNKAKVIEDL